MITKIEPRWNERYANQPDIVVTVDCEMPHWDTFLWLSVPEYNKRENTMLISANVQPWCKFVYIADPNGRSQDHGALGGDYCMTDGTVFKSRTGWSSRDGVINRDYAKWFGDEITEVTVKTPRGSNWAGYSLKAHYLMNHELWPDGTYLVRNMVRDEPYWTISTDPLKVVKPNE